MKVNFTFLYKIGIFDHITFHHTAAVRNKIHRCISGSLVQYVFIYC